MRCSSLYRPSLRDVLSKVKAFIFDFDGTLIDSVDAHIESWIIAIDKVLNIKFRYEDVYPLIGLSGLDIIKNLLGDLGLKHYSEIRRIKDRAYLRMIKEGVVEVLPGVTKLLKILKLRGYLIAIVSSTPNHILLHLSQYLGIDAFIDHYIGGDEVSRGKPNPDIFAKAIKDLGLEPHESVIVGDTSYDIRPAKELGAFSILVNRDVSTVNPKPDHYFRMFHEFTDSLIKLLL